MLKDKRTTLRSVTLQTGFIRAQKCHASAFDRLLQAGAAAFDRTSLMRIVAIGAAHFTFHDRMTVRQLELGAHFEVTLKTGIRRAARVDDGASRTAALDVEAARPVTRFAPDVLGVVSLDL